MNHHYVPQWYQKRMLLDSSKLYYFNIINNELKYRPPKYCFCEDDFYKAFIPILGEEYFEEKMFGSIDLNGTIGIETISNDYFNGDLKPPKKFDRSFSFFVEFLGAQMFRTHKGLNKIEILLKDRISLKNEMLKRNAYIAYIDKIKGYYGTLWAESYWDIVTADSKSLGFIISDNPVTIFNHACYPGSKDCLFPNDPNPEFIGSQTIFPLAINKCLILTNKEHITCKGKYPKKRRTNLDPYRTAIFNFLAIDRHRVLDEEEVQTINYIIKNRAHQFIAANSEQMLYPERYIKNTNWSKLHKVLLPKPNYDLSSERLTAIYDDGSQLSRDYLGR